MSGISKSTVTTIPERLLVEENGLSRRYWRPPCLARFCGGKWNEGQKGAPDRVDEKILDDERGQDQGIGSDGARRGDIGSELTAGGYLELVPPAPQIVSADIDGRITVVNVVEGQHVEAGDVLVRLDDTPYRKELAVEQARLDQARAELERLEAGFRTEEIDVARARKEEAQAEVELAAKQVERIRSAVASEARPVSELDEAEATLVGARARVARWEAELDRLRAGRRFEDIAIGRSELAGAEAARQLAKWQVESTEIRAPDSGTVLDVFVRPGQWVNRSEKNHDDDGPPGGLVAIGDPLDVRAWVDVQQRYADRISVGQSVRLYTEARPDEPLRGHVSDILPRASLQRNTIRIIISIAEPEDYLRPQMAVRVRFMD